MCAEENGSVRLDDLLDVVPETACRRDSRMRRGLRSDAADPERAHDCSVKQA
jgi:hypothetical protein